MATSEMIQFLNFFLIYAFLGWVVEVIYHAVCQGVIVNRGFLNGPICPIYGFGMLLILYLLLPISDNLLVLLLGGMLLTTSIELFGGWALEKLFHMRWWDYSKEPLNLHGYICLKFSIAWGLGVVAVMRIVHPIVANVSGFVLRTPLKIVLIPLMILFFVDIVVTVKTVTKLQKELRMLEYLAKEMREFSDSLTDVIGNKAHEVDVKMDEGRVQAALGKAELKKQMEERKLGMQSNVAERRAMLEKTVEERRVQIEKIQKKLGTNRIFGTGRLVAAFPHAVLVKHDMHLSEYIGKHR